MIDVDYNEYKETLAENMKLIMENHDLKERLSIYESDSDTVIMSKEKWEETKKELEIEKDIINGALAIANERFNYYYNHNKESEEFEDWHTIFSILLRRDNR